MNDEIINLNEVRKNMIDLITIVQKGLKEHDQKITKLSGALESHIKCMHFALGDEVQLEKPVELKHCKKCVHKPLSNQMFPCSDCNNYSEFKPF